MNHCRFVWFTNALLLVVLLSVPILATPYAIIHSDVDSYDYFVSAEVLEDDWYHEGLLLDDVYSPTDREIVFFDADGFPLYTETLRSDGIILKFDIIADTSSIAVLRKDNVLLEQELSFCDFDGVCEPCEGSDCKTAENYISCEDCSSGSKDNYCDLVSDGICDLDCEGEDADCTSCIRCLSIEDKPRLCVEDFGGDICFPNEECVGDRTEVVTADADGGARCCVGDAECVPAVLRDKIVGEETIKGLSKESELTDVENEIEEFTDEELQEIIDSTDSFSGLPEQEESKDIVESAKESFESLPEEANYFIWVGVSAIVILFLVILIAVFSKISSKKLRNEELESADVARRKVYTAVAELVAKGYSYAQIKDMLINEGNDLVIVQDAINEHYRSLGALYGKKV